MALLKYVILGSLGSEETRQSLKDRCGWARFFVATQCRSDGNNTRSLSSMCFHFYCDDLGYDLLAGLFKRTGIEELGHVERLAKRILFLKGEFEMAPSMAP